MPGMTQDGSELAGQEFFQALRGPTDFYLVRHGESEGNALNIIQGHLDYPLNDSGRTQASAAGDWFRDREISAAFCSPLKRALETAELIAAKLSAGPVVTDHAFKEIDTGIFSGKSMEENARSHPEDFRRYLQSSWEGVPGAERKADLYGRAMDAWRLMRDRSLEGEGAILAVTHGGFIQWMVRAVSGTREWMPLYPTGNCGVFHLRCTPNATGELPLLQWKLLNFEPDFGVKRAKPVF